MNAMPPPEHEPMTEVEVVVMDRRWAEAVPDVTGVADRVCAALDRLQPPGGPAGFGLALSDDAHLARLNRDFRGRDRPTNVLAFPAISTPVVETGGEPTYLGDVAVSFDTVLKESKAAACTLPERLSHMIIHGLLHLKGYDHQNDDDACLMEGLEAQVLAALGYADPYRLRDAVQEDGTD